MKISLTHFRHGNEIERFGSYHQSKNIKVDALKKRWFLTNLSEACWFVVKA